MPRMAYLLFSTALNGILCYEILKIRMHNCYVVCCVNVSRLSSDMRQSIVCTTHRAPNGTQIKFVPSPLARSITFSVLPCPI